MEGKDLRARNIETGLKSFNKSGGGIKGGSGETRLETHKGGD